jgi:hypothetical protein
VEILYVIGNGFDLWHGLPTKYSQFYEHSAGLLDEVSEYFDINVDHPLWTDFENDLGKFCWRSLYSAYNYNDVSDEGFKPSMIYSFEDDLTQQAGDLTESIQEAFKEWIESISLDDVQQQFAFRYPSKFLTFNYTSLLDQIYNIPRSHIFHIHGNAVEYDNLIIGHNRAIDREPELDEEGNSNRHPFSDAEGAAQYPLYAFRKPVEDILQSNHEYFLQLQNIKFIVVLGHSINDIDLPYFRNIHDNVPGATWVVSQYDDNEGARHASQLFKCGVATQRLVMSSIENIPARLDELRLV